MSDWLLDNNNLPFDPYGAINSLVYYIRQIATDPITGIQSCGLGLPWNCEY